jgi:predicted nuclease of predicted toxin-antitoxin system
MRFLVDAQLPLALAQWLQAEGHDALHVAEIGMLGAPDSVIWDHALQTRSALITKDEDFPSRSLRQPVAPFIVWVRIGNCSNAALRQWFLPLLPRIEAAHAAGERLVELV